MGITAIATLPGWFSAWDDKGKVRVNRLILAIARDDTIELIDGDSSGYFENPQGSQGFLGFFHADDEGGRAMLAKAECARW